MRSLVPFLAAVPVALMAFPAQAQDAVATTAIVSGDFASAESKLLGELRIHPGRPELLLNLAAVYAQTGRMAEARSLYTKVLAQDEVLMDLTQDRTAGSHAIARKGLRHLEAVQFSAR